MHKKYFVLLGLLILLGSATSAPAQISIAIGTPNVQIGIDLPLYPELMPVPGYPVYYAPQVSANYFFYDGMYWVYQDDNWYASTWYNGPWGFVEPEFVPVFLLRVPVAYYLRPPVYFRGWQPSAPPRWGEHWGRGWEERHRGWDRWDRRHVPLRAPRPLYQRHYAGDRYPRHLEQQHRLQRQEYRYQPRETVVREHYRKRDGGQEPQARNPRQQQGDSSYENQGRGDQDRRPRSQDRGDAQGNRGQGQRPDEERGRGHNKD